MDCLTTDFLGQTFGSRIQIPDIQTSRMSNNLEYKDTSFYQDHSLQRPATRVFLLACRYEFVKSDPGSFSPILNDRQSRISTYRFYTLNSQRSEKTQLTQDMYKFCFKLYTIRNRNTRKVSCMKVHWSLSLGL